MYKHGDIHIPKHECLSLDLLTAHNPACATVLGLLFPIIWISLLQDPEFEEYFVLRPGIKAVLGVKAAQHLGWLLLGSSLGCS